MVFTLTFCPCLEYSASLKEISVGADNVVSNGALDVAGGGAVIASVLKELGVQSTVLGFAAGFTGGEIEEILRKRGINTDIVYLENGLSPFNVVINHGAGKENPTRFEQALPKISYENLMALFARLERISDGDALVLSGDIPDSLPSDVYAHIPDAFSGRDVRLILDIPAESLAKCLKFNPFLVVTDRERLTETFGEPPETEEQLVSYIKHIQELGAQNVLVLPETGTDIILLDGNQNLLKQSAADTSLNDITLNSITAGFIASSEDHDVDSEYALILAASSGRAASASGNIPSKAEIINIMKKMLR